MTPVNGSTAQDSTKAVRWLQGMRERGREKDEDPDCIDLRGTQLVTLPASRFLFP